MNNSGEKNLEERVQCRDKESNRNEHVLGGYNSNADEGGRRVRNAPFSLCLRTDQPTGTHNDKVSRLVASPHL